MTVTVHVLVAESFYGPRPEGLVVCHRNGNGHDNRIANLRYGTPASNEADKIAHGTSQHGERNPAATLSDEEVEQIRELRRAGVKLKVLAAQFGVAESTVSRIAAGIRRGGIPQIDPPGGKFVEAGVAIGRGKRVAVWGRRENILMHHPRVGQADDLLGAVALLGAVPAGAGDVGTN